MVKKTSFKTTKAQKNRAKTIHQLLDAVQICQIKRELDELN